MKNQTKIKLVKVIFIVVATLVIGLFFGLQEYIYLLEQYPDFYPEPVNSFFLHPLGGLFAGIIFGFSEVFFFRKYFRRKSFGFAIIIEVVLFLILFLFFSLVLSFILNATNSNEFLFNKNVVSNTFDFIGSVSFYLNMINWGVAFFLILFVLQVSDKFGHGILYKFLLGEYHQPKSEERIFLFIDLNSSTVIGEKLGHVEYHRLLNDFFSDLTPAIINSGGEIYQYVGDEISASWLIKNNNYSLAPINCFFEIVDTIKKKSETYKSKYDLIPEFKAGIHCGKVTVGEVGIIKKEIVFTGDVLNTTARIINQCPKFEQPLLVSEDVVSKIDFPRSMEIKQIIQVKLRGKISKTALYSIQRRS